MGAASSETAVRLPEVQAARLGQGEEMSAQQFAMHLVNLALRRGLLKKPTLLRCVDCGEKAACYEHRDYNKPLDVVPVCQRCNCKRGSAKKATKRTLARIKLFGLRIEAWQSEAARRALRAILNRTLTCRCGYKWTPRKAGRPKECPECKVRDWDDRKRTA